ncbi:MAG: ATP-binding protein [Thermodesulfobacteriota bacterium]|nr:ATP-binding protein [Thermodesulfobacteriota bacterium]
MNIRKRLNLGLSLFVVLVGIVGSANLLYLHSTNKWFKIHERLDRIRINFLDARREEKNWLLFREHLLCPEGKTHLEKFRTFVSRIRVEVKKGGKLINLLDDYTFAFEKIVASGRKDKKQVFELSDKAELVQAAIDEIAEDTDCFIRSSQKKDFIITVSIFITSILILIFLGQRLSTGIVGPISQLKGFAGLLAAGKLDQEVAISSSDEIEDLAYSFDEMRKKLKTSKQELVKSERLATMGQLAAHVGHEIRNPLSVIKSSAYYLKMKLGNTDNKVTEHIKRIERQVSISDKIISDLLDFSRIRTPVFGEVQINDIIEEVISDFTIPEGIQLVKELKRTLPPIRADRDQLRLVFVNMVINAIDIMPEGGRLHIKTEGNEGLQEIEFKDTGYGISKEDQEKVFAPLFSTKTHGIGLGLTLCKAIVEEHGGNIEVKSKEGKGTSFIIRLPLV